MKIENEKFNKWLEEEKGITWWKRRFIKSTGKLSKTYKAGYVYRVTFIRQAELIGLMTQWLLDNGFNIEPFAERRYVTKDTEMINYRENISVSVDLFTALKDAIEGVEVSDGNTTS